LPFSAQPSSPERVWALALAKRFLGAGLATARFTAFPRADLEALRALGCVVAFRFRASLFSSLEP